jgi:G3E family GTPase
MHSIGFGSIDQAARTATTGASFHRETRLTKTESASIYVIGGFFGSGKTTLLSRLVREALASGARPAAVLNEFSGAHGATPGAAALLAWAGDEREVETRVVVTRCVCCDPKNALAAEVAALLRRDRAPIFVETTGLTSLARTAEAVAGVLRRGRRGGRLISVIAVVDARRWSGQKWQGHDPAEEVLGADTIVLNKVDTLSRDDVKAAFNAIAVHNPSARILETSFAAVSLKELAQAERSDIVAKAPDEGESRRLTDELEAVTAQILGPLMTDRLAAVLPKYEGLVRLKGLARTTESWRLQELQWTPGGLEVRPARLAGPKARPEPQLTIVGRGVDWDAFVDDLDACVSSAAPELLQRGA